MSHLDDFMPDCVIVGALHGPGALPSDWLEPLVLRDVIHSITQDAFAEFSSYSPTDASWTRRYPGW